MDGLRRKTVLFIFKKNANVYMDRFNHIEVVLTDLTVSDVGNKMEKQH